MENNKEFREGTVAHVKTMINKIRALKTRVPDSTEEREEVLDTLRYLIDNLKSALNVTLEDKNTETPSELKVFDKAKEKIINVARKKDFSQDEVQQIDKALKKELASLKKTFDDLDSNDFVFEFKDKG